MFAYVREERSAEITARPGMKLRVFDKANLNQTRDDVRKALKKLKLGCSAGMRGVAMEYLRSGGKTCGEWMAIVLKMCSNCS